MTKETKDKAEALKHLTGNSLSGLIDYLISKEYAYSQKYKTEGLNNANYHVSQDKLRQWASQHGMTLKEAYDVLDYDWLNEEEQEEKGSN